MFQCLLCPFLIFSSVFGTDRRRGLYTNGENLNGEVLNCENADCWKLSLMVMFAGNSTIKTAIEEMQAILDLKAI